MKVLGGAIAPRQARSPSTASREAFEHRRTARRAGIAVIHQEFNLVPGLTAVRKHLSGPGNDAGRLPRPQTGTPPCCRSCSARLGVDIDLDRALPEPDDGPAATRRDRPGARLRAPHPRHGRADGGAHRARGRPALRDHRRAEEAGHRHHLHQPSARRDLRRRRPRDCAARRRQRRRAAHRSASRATRWSR